MARVRTLTFVAAMALAVALAVAGTQAVAPPGGPSEGVGVHGAWTIEVHNADGTLDARQEFHNDLTVTGELALIRTLARDTVPGRWSIRLAEFDTTSATFTGVCNASDPSPCILWEGDGTDTDEEFYGLEVEEVLYALRLSGSIEASVDGSIENVTTRLDACSDTTVSPSECAAGSADDTLMITSTGITPVDVAAGQTVQVEVQITFRTAA